MSADWARSLARVARVWPVGSAPELVASSVRQVGPPWLLAGPWLRAGPGLREGPGPRAAPRLQVEPLGLEPRLQVEPLGLLVRSSLGLGTSGGPTQLLPALCSSGRPYWDPSGGFCRACLLWTLLAPLQL